MLSKVLKGADAVRVRAMDFSAAPAPEKQPRPPGSSDRASDANDAGDQPMLLDRIRTLEAGLAAAEREAFGNGRKQGEEEARSALAPVLERMNTSIANVIAMRPELRRRAERDAVE